MRILRAGLMIATLAVMGGCKAERADFYRVNSNHRNDWSAVAQDYLRGQNIYHPNARMLEIVTNCFRQANDNVETPAQAIRLESGMEKVLLPDRGCLLGAFPMPEEAADVGMVEAGKEVVEASSIKIDLGPFDPLSIQLEDYKIGSDHSFRVELPSNFKLNSGSLGSIFIPLEQADATIENLALDGVSLSGVFRTGSGFPRRPALPCLLSFELKGDRSFIESGVELEETDVPLIVRIEIKSTKVSVVPPPPRPDAGTMPDVFLPLP